VGRSTPDEAPSVRRAIHRFKAISVTITAPHWTKQVITLKGLNGLNQLSGAYTAADW
jgi:hypothetical protein